MPDVLGVCLNVQFFRDHYYKGFLSPFFLAAVNLAFTWSYIASILFDKYIEGAVLLSPLVY